jgi:hypothetical protein
MRHCIRCGAEITAYMGAVLARDCVAAWDGKIPWTSVREHCGKCAEWINFLPSEQRREYLMGLSFP